MTEYERENFYPCGVAGCEKAAIHKWSDGLWRCRLHDAVMQDTITQEMKNKSRREWLEGHLYAQMVLDAHKPFGKRGVTDEDLQVYAALAKRYAAHLVDE